MTTSPLEALLNKMSSMQEKAYCVFEYAKTSSVTAVQRHFRTKFRKEPPHQHNISRWVKQFCALSNSCVFGPFFLAENSINGDIYQDMLSEWLLPQLEEAVPDFILQQDGAPPRWNINVREFLNECLGLAVLGHRI